MRRNKELMNAEKTAEETKERLWQHFQQQRNEYVQLQDELTALESRRDALRQNEAGLRRSLECSSGLPWEQLVADGLVPAKSVAEESHGSSVKPADSSRTTFRGQNLRDLVQATYPSFDVSAEFTLADVCRRIEAQYSCTLTEAERKRVSSVLQWDGLYHRLERVGAGVKAKGIATRYRRLREAQGQSHNNRRGRVKAEHAINTETPLTMVVLKALRSYEARDDASASRTDARAIRIFVEEHAPELLRNRRNAIHAVLSQYRRQGLITSDGLRSNRQFQLADKGRQRLAEYEKKHGRTP